MNPLGSGLRQPDARSCGAASLLMARLLREDRTLDQQGFAAEALTLHRRLTSVRDSAGRHQLPWPRALGTPPWAIRRELETLTGRDHDLRLARWSRAAAYDRLARTGGVLYVGSPTLPRHVVLVLGHDGAEATAAAGLRCYQPSVGRVEPLEREEFLAGELARAGWPVPWFTITAQARA